MPELPKLPKLDKNPIRTVGNIIREVITGVEKAVSDIDSAVKGIDSEIRSPIKEKEPEKKAEESPNYDITTLKEYLEKKKVEKALSELEKGEGKEKNLDTVKKYIEGDEL